MPETKARKKPGQRRWIYGASFLFVALISLGGILAYWKWIYLPSMVLTALRTERVGGIEAGREEIPEIVKTHFLLARPELVDMLYGEDEGKAALAFVALRFEPKGIQAVLERFHPDDPGEGPLRAALLLEWAGKVDFLSGGHPRFLSRFLRWKSRVRSGPFCLPPTHRIDAAEALLAQEGSDSVPFLIDLICTPTTPRGQKKSMIHALGKRPEIRSVVLQLRERGVSSVLILKGLMAAESATVKGIMGQALSADDPAEVSTAVDYFLLHADPESARRLAPLAASPKTSWRDRRRLVDRFLALDTDWPAAWAIRVIASWPDKDVVTFLSTLPEPTHLSKENAADNFLLLVGDHGNPVVRRAALKAWVRREGQGRLDPFGVFEPQALARSLDAVISARAWKRAGPSPSFPSPPLSQVRDAALSFPSLEREGRVGPNAGDLQEGTQAAVSLCYEGFVQLGTLPALQRDLVRFLGNLHHRHGTVLANRSDIRAALYRRVCTSFSSEVRVEAAFWLARSRGKPGGGIVLRSEERERVIKALRAGMARMPATRFACAAALMHLENGGTSPVARSRSEGWEPFRKALAGTNAVAAFLAAREVPHLPPGFLGRTVSPLLRLTAFPVPSSTLPRVAAKSLDFLSCPEEGKTMEPWDSLQEEGEPIPLRVVWAGRTGVPPDPEGRVSVLDRLAGIAAAPTSDAGRVRAAIFLLRRWTGEHFGFHPAVLSPGHAR
ncbi:MAG: hypothetical protein ACYTHN_08215, partial [Planctomycetota bacterium]